ncbi:MAG TPA: histidinol-phosphate transaminase [Stellaceae bacterium]|nr:histidinol-phosphate transaminase [Stellaceae bacterium]
MSAEKIPEPQPGVLDIAPYRGGEAGAPGFARPIRLASNESALGPSARAMEAYKALAGEIHRYPDGGAEKLRQVLARRYGVDAERIVCGNGSDELIGLLTKAYAGPGDEVLYSRHGFMMYPIAAKAAGATPVAAPESNLTFDVDAMLKAVTPRTKIVFLANPNNPTGTYIPVEEVKRLHAGLPKSTLLIIDAAYAEYVQRNDYEPGVSLVESAKNVVMTRTFSKIYALGGLRVGWAYCSAPVADVLNRVRGPFNLNAAAQAAAVAAVEDVAAVDRAREHNDIWRPWFEKALAGLGLTVNPSVANFVIVKFSGERGKTADAAFEFLKSRGILTRKMGGYHLAEWLRVSIGTEEEMRAVVEACGDFLRGS